MRLTLSMYASKLPTGPDRTKSFFRATSAVAARAVAVIWTDLLGRSAYLVGRDISSRAIRVLKALSVPSPEGGIRSISYCFISPGSGAGLDRPEVSAGGDEGAQPAKGRPDSHEYPHALAAEARQVETAAVLRGQLADRLVEPGKAAEHDERRQQRPAEAVEDAGVQERPPNESVRATDQLGDLDFRPPLLDLEPDGIADDGQHPEPEHGHHQPHDPPEDIEQRMQASYPVEVELHDIDLGKRGEIAAQGFHLGGAAGVFPGPNHQVVRQGIVLEGRQRIAEARGLLELLERLRSTPDGDGSNVRAIARALGDLLHTLDG